MTGTGTQTDPYIVDNWADFVTAITTSGAYVAFPEGFSIDMNGIAPEGIKSQIEPICAHVEGNGAIIRNLHIHNTNLFYRNGGTQTVFENLNFLDMYMLNSTSTLGGYYFLALYGTEILFKGCKFSGELNAPTSSSSLYLAGGYQVGMPFERCSLKFRCSGNVGLFTSSYGQPGIKNSRMKITGTCGTSKIRLYNSLLTGEIKANKNTDIFTFYPSPISAADLTISGYSEIVHNGNIANMLIANSDKISDGTIIDDTINLCTTAQLGDATYLSSLGFPIGVD